LIKGTGRWGAILGAETLWREEAAGFNLSEAFFQREELRDFPPPPGVAEIGQVKPVIAGALGIPVKLNARSGGKSNRIPG
jgi:hypothetical protein